MPEKKCLNLPSNFYFHFRVTSFCLNLILMCKSMQGSLHYQRCDISVFQPAGKSASLSKAGRPGVCWESDANNETSLSRLQSSRRRRNARPATLLTRTCSQAIDFKGQNRFHRSLVEIDRWHSPELLRYLAKVRQF